MSTNPEELWDRICLSFHAGTILPTCDSHSEGAYPQFASSGWPEQETDSVEAGTVAHRFMDRSIILCPDRGRRGPHSEVRAASARENAAFLVEAAGPGAVPQAHQAAQEWPPLREDAGTTPHLTGRSAVDQVGVSTSLIDPWSDAGYYSIEDDPC